MPQCAVVTGSTGAIGPMLVEELLGIAQFRRLSLLVRSDPRELELAHGNARIRPVRADLRVDGFGVHPGEIERASADADIIIHAAADTRFRTAAEELWNTNVGGTRRMLELARRCRQLKKFIFVSTVCVSGTSTGVIPESHPHTPPGFINEYERSKFEAERLVLASGLPVEIVRLSIVIGSCTGAVHRHGAIHHILRWFGRGLVPQIPGTPQSLLDLIATETAAKFIARCAVSAVAPGAIYHVAAGQHAASLVDFRAFATELFYGPDRSPDRAARIVDAETFAAFRESVGGTNRLIAQATESIVSFVPTLLYPRVYDTTRAQQLWGGPLPLYDWRATLRRVMQRARLGARPPAPNRIAAA